MNRIQFRSLDLNLFRVFLALLDRRSVSMAAADLALTPSAVSHALGRLREALGDPLFERRAGGLAPTPYALELGRRAAPAIEQLRGATEPIDFDAAVSERHFVIAGGSYSASVILPALLDRLQRTAPYVRIRFVPITADFLDAIERGRVDLAFGLAAPQGRRLDWRRLIQDDMVWVARRDHPFIRAPLTMGMLKRARHVVMERMAPMFEDDEYAEARRFFDESAELRSAYEEAVEGAAAGGRTSATVADISHALALVSRSDAVTLTFRRFAKALAPDVLQLLKPPHATPKVEIGAIAARRGDPGVEWLLKELAHAGAGGRA